MVRTPVAIAILLFLVACSTPSAIDRSPAPSPAVDSARVPSAEQALAWRHARFVSVDLNGDGRDERVSLRSDVSIGSNGKPLWEDGHRWAVVIESDGRSTLAYGAFVPNGHVEIGILDTKQILVVERNPQQLRTLVIAFDRSGNATTVSSATHSVQQWLPDLRAAS